MKKPKFEQIIDQLTLLAVREVQTIYTHTHHLNKKVSGSRDVQEVFRKLFDINTICYKEEFWYMALSRRNNIIAVAKLSSGGTTGTVADPKMMFSQLLRIAAPCVILCHNHPSGGLIPSDEDIKLTKKFKQAGDLLDIKVLDHIILSGPENAYYSFADDGQM